MGDKWAHEPEEYRCIGDSALTRIPRDRNARKVSVSEAYLVSFSDATSRGSLNYQKAPKMSQTSSITYHHESVPKQRHAALFSTYLVLELIMVCLALILIAEPGFCLIPTVLCCVMIPSMFYMILILARMCVPGFLKLDIGPDDLTLRTAGRPAIFVPGRSIIAVDIQDFVPGAFYKRDGRPSGVNITWKTEAGTLQVMFIHDLLEIKRRELAVEIMDWIDRRSDGFQPLSSNLFPSREPQREAVVTSNKVFTRMFRPS